MKRLVWISDILQTKESFQRNISSQNQILTVTELSTISFNTYLCSNLSEYRVQWNFNSGSPSSLLAGCT